MSYWTISIACSTCDAKITRRGDDSQALSAECDEAARAAGWLLLPPVSGRRAFPVQLCADCVVEVQP